jgi:hypothetical protein
MKIRDGGLNMGDSMTRMLVAVGLDPLAFIVSLGFAIAGTALIMFMLSAPVRGRIWAAAFLLVGGSLLLSGGVGAQEPADSVAVYECPLGLP